MIFSLTIFILATQFSHQAKPFEIVSTTETLPVSDGAIDKKLAEEINRCNRLVQKLVTQDKNPSCNALPKNCLDVQERNHNGSNTYLIQPKFATSPFQVFCDMNIRGGGWTYLLRRLDGSQEFYGNWDEYKEGFGNLKGEFWLGLEKIHLLTGYEFNQVLIELTDWDLKKKYAHYDIFSIGNEKEGYHLKLLQGFSGDAGDSMHDVVGMKFTTKDRDQDLWDEGNCADWSYAGWWYNSCKSAQLTGKYLPKDKGSDNYKGIYWTTFHGGDYSMKEVKMMIRPKKYYSNNY